MIEYGQGALAGMAAFERNSIGDKNTFFAGKYTVGNLALMAAYDDSRELASQRQSRSKTISASYRWSPITLKAGYGRQRLNADINQFLSFGAD